MYLNIKYKSTVQIQNTADKSTRRGRKEDPRNTILGKDVPRDNYIVVCI